MGDIDQVITEKSDLVYLKIKGLYIKSVEFVPYYSNGNVEVKNLELLLSYGLDERMVFDMRVRTVVVGVDKLVRRGFEKVRCTD